jgi:CheY-like chemotaxis protein/anti-sigma regulatory factor (Ser/Thr protein kinase)
MTRILVAEDSPTEAQLIRYLLEKAEFEVLPAADGRSALEVIERTVPDLVLTDLQMPEMNGLELVRQIRSKYSFLPVILMTAHGSEDIAVEALRTGAASYVPKAGLAQSLVSTIREVLGVAKLGRPDLELLECLAYADSGFVLANSSVLIPALVRHLLEHTALMKLCDETGLMRLGLALDEALVNALYHGNLELDSRPGDEDATEWNERAQSRSQQPPYRDRRIHVTVNLSRAEAVFVIRDEGPGFDLSQIPDPTDPANLESTTGRGLLLIRTFMDDVTHNPKGNEITIVMRREQTSMQDGE